MPIFDKPTGGKINSTNNIPLLASSSASKTEIPVVTQKRGVVPGLPVVLKPTTDRIVPQTSAYLQWLRTSQRMNKTPSGETTQERYKKMPSIPRVSFVRNSSLDTLQTAGENDLEEMEILRHKSIASDIDLNSMEGRGSSTPLQQKAYKDQLPQPTGTSFEKMTATAGIKSYRPGSAYW